MTISPKIGNQSEIRSKKITLIKNIGFELELAVSEEGYKRIDELDKSANLGLEFDGDGSIRETAECSQDLELKISEPKHYTYIIGLANKLFPLLKSLERENHALVNSSCGLHFHFDMRTLTFQQLQQTYENWRSWGENWFYQILPSHRHNNPYSKAITEYDFRRWLEISDKYWSMSPHFFREGGEDIPTIEFRLFPATLNSFHFLSYLRLNKLFIDSLGKREIFDEKVGKNDLLLNFIKSRKKVLGN